MKLVLIILVLFVAFSLSSKYMVNTSQSHKLYRTRKGGRKVLTGYGKAMCPQAPMSSSNSIIWKKLCEENSSLKSKPRYVKRQPSRVAEMKEAQLAPIQIKK